MQTISGKVQKGAARGRTLGYPTINLPLGDYAVSGVYSALVYLEDKSVNTAAVFADPIREIIEAHILDFDGDLYGQKVTLELYEKIRDIKKFYSDDELKLAIEEDINKIRQSFDN